MFSSQGTRSRDSNHERIKIMSYQDLTQIIPSTNKLSPDEQLQLIAHLTNNMRDNGHKTQKRYSWHDIAGILPAHPLDEDAQAWISRTRQGGT
jgi:SpoVK/Ycf46/Vps4 family AAA+-type ATPase